MLDPQVIVNLLQQRGHQSALLKGAGRAARAVRCSLSKVHSEGLAAHQSLSGLSLIQIRAEFDSPSAYPRPGSSFTTML